MNVVNDREHVLVDHSRADNAARDEELGVRLDRRVADEVQSDEGQDATSGRVRAWREVHVEIGAVEKEEPADVNFRTVNFLNAVDVRAAGIAPEEGEFGVP